jgi:hypothetical protein
MVIHITIYGSCPNLIEGEGIFVKNLVDASGSIEVQFKTVNRATIVINFDPDYLQ